MISSSALRRCFMIIGVVALAASLRIVALDQLPPSLFRDEAEKAWNGYSLWMTGKDMSGKPWPVFINVLGVTTSAIYQYLVMPFVALLGLNEWSARLPAAVAGTATVWITYALASRAGGVGHGLIAALLLAISPWHIVFSRWAQQGIMLPLLLGAAMFCLCKCMQCGPGSRTDSGAESEVSSRSRTGRTAWACACAFLLGFATYVYDVARLFVPLLIVWSMAANLRGALKEFRTILLAGLAFLLGALPTAYILIFDVGAAQARFRAISIAQPGAAVTDVAIQFVTNVISHWSPSFLLIRGDLELRHGAGVGVLSMTEAVLLALGMARLAFRRTAIDRILLGWLLLFPVAASLTKVGIPHSLRSIVALPAVQIVAGEGALWAVSRIPAARRSFVWTVIAVAALAASLPFAMRYYSRSYRERSAISWQYGAKEAMRLLSQAELQHARVRFDTLSIYGAQYLVAFYGKLPPEEIQRNEWGRYSFGPPIGQEPTGQLMESPFVYVTLPGFPAPTGWRPIAIYALDDDRNEPVMMLYFNPLARKLIEG